MTGSGFLERRCAGVLAHLSSLPGDGGTGNLGHEAYRFVDWLASSGFTVWQMLPLGPTHDDLSPYQGLSVHGGEPAYIDLQALVEAGWLSANEARPPHHGRHSPELRAWRHDCLRRARATLLDQPEEATTTLPAIEAFRAANAYWLEDFALYIALREEHNHAPWWEWPIPERDRHPEALEAARSRQSAAIEQVIFEQYLFFSQWAALRSYAHAHGIQLLGDLPIFVAHDSAEAWAHRAHFLLDPDGQPAAVAGVPPDDFAADGQHWGNPLYDWDHLQETGFQWWLERLATQLALFDALRLDHFRGLCACWSIPAEAETPREGHWEEVPGDALLEAVRARFGDVPLVAEDLGVITEEVTALRERFALPGMGVLQFAFDGDATNPYLPHNHRRDRVIYTGTHDNNTTLGWYRQLPPETATRLRAYLGHPGEAFPWPLVRAALASVADLAVIPMQDLLALGAEHRMNIPGVAEGNWRWRFAWEQVPAGHAQQLRALNRLYGRCP